MVSAIPPYVPYVDTLARLNPLAKTVGCDHEPFDGTYPLRHPVLYERLLALKPALTGRESNIAVLGSGRCYYESPKIDAKKQFSPFAIELIALLHELSAHITFIDSERPVLETALATPAFYQLYYEQQHLVGTPVLKDICEALATVLRSVDGAQLLATDRQSDECIFEIDKSRYERGIVRGFQGDFTRLDFGEQQVDVMIATVSAMYGFSRLPPDRVAGLAYVARLIGALKMDGGVLFVSPIEFNALWGADHRQVFNHEELTARLETLRAELEPLVGGTLTMTHVERPYGSIIEVVRGAVFGGQYPAAWSRQDQIDAELLLSGLRTTPLLLRHDVLGVLRAPAKHDVRFFNSFLSFDEAFRSLPAGEKHKDLRVSTADYEREIAGYVAKAVSDEKEGLRDLVYKLRYLAPCLPDLLPALESLEKRLRQQPDVWEGHSLKQSVERAARDSGEPVAVRVIAVEELSELPSRSRILDEDQLRKWRDSNRDFALYALQRLDIEGREPAYRHDAETISFVLDSPGLSLSVHHGPYGGSHTRGVEVQDFQLTYDPSHFSSRDLIRRTLGSKPLTYTMADLRSFSQSELVSSEGTFLQLYLNGVTAEQRKNNDGPLLMISRDTGKVMFFPPDYNVDRWKLLSGLTGLWTDIQNLSNHSSRTGTWQADMPSGRKSKG